MLHQIHSPAPGSAPDHPPTALFAHTRPDAPDAIPLLAYTREEKIAYGLQLDFVDHWRMPSARVNRFVGHMWSYWLRNPNLLLSWTGGFDLFAWTKALESVRCAPYFNCLDVCGSQPTNERLALEQVRAKGHPIWSMWGRMPLACIQPCERANAFDLSVRDGYSAARRWNEHAAQSQSAALRILLTSSAHARLADDEYGRQLPATLCGLRFDRIARALANEGILAQYVVAADVFVVQSDRTCERFTTLDMRVDHLIAPDPCSCVGAPALACLVLLLMGDHVVACAWASPQCTNPDDDGAPVAFFSRAIPSGGTLSPRFIVVWVAQNTCCCSGIVVRPCKAPPRISARMVVGRDSMCLRPWILADDTMAEVEEGHQSSLLITCFGATQRLPPKRSELFNVPDTELLMLELGEVTSMIDTCGDIGALLETRWRYGRWRLPPGACGCGCGSQDSTPTSACAMVHVAEADEDEAPKDTEARMAMYLCTPTLPTTAERIERDRALLLAVDGKPFDLSDAAMDNLANSATARAFLARLDREKVIV